MRYLSLLVVALPIAAAQALAQGMQIPKPSPGLMPNPGAGRALYERACAQCHGVDLRGSKEGPALLHRVYEPSHHADIAFQIAVKYGSRQHHWNFGDMKPVADVTPDDVAHITAYVRAEQRKVGVR